jgi:hypothetical protein
MVSGFALKPLKNFLIFTILLKYSCFKETRALPGGDKKSGSHNKNMVHTINTDNKFSIIFPPDGTGDFQSLWLENTI